ncbi:glycoside hydrolase 3 protein [Brettanomyces nanus]|uniref:glucan 1,3-beta-glucosidase n=1 Tax=Eeniella nana TaxID=13502 RepID=A0A875RQE2_EENNA|nr:glycoside hydrolase 3 protein [Brettanomyces nanus]QPG76670.1 glycoside hydrolase 3 protein [Brettanomyces nanus]
MKFSYSLLTTIALVASSVSAEGSLGFNLGVENNDGTCKSSSDYESNLDILSSYSQVLKVYSVSDCNTLEYLGPAAETKGFKLALGVWPTPDSKFSSEKEALQSYLPKISKSTVQSFLVGSEALYREDMTAQELADDINTIKTLLSDIVDKNGDSYSDVPVGTVDSWNVLVDGANTAAIKAADVVYANAFSYWQGQAMNNASFSFFDDIMQAMQSIQTIKGTTDIEFWVGETGWPTEGSNYGSAVPSVDNAAQFWQEGICAMRGWGINTFVFEAFDEAWKPETSGSSVEPYWGVFDKDGNIKFDISCDFTS